MVNLLRQNPLLVPFMILSPIALAVLVFAVMKLLEAREERLKASQWEMFRTPDTGRETEESKTSQAKPEDALPRPKTERELTLEDLRVREERLREREERLKRRKMLELEEKEKSVERKHVTGIVKDERKITDAMEEEEEEEQLVEETVNNRKRLVKLMELAEDRYKDGLMSEKNFRSIMNSYQKELVETDVEMNRLHTSLT